MSLAEHTVFANVHLRAPSVVAGYTGRLVPLFNLPLMVLWLVKLYVDPAAAIHYQGLP